MHNSINTRFNGKKLQLNKDMNFYKSIIKLSGSVLMLSIVSLFPSCGRANKLKTYEDCEFQDGSVVEGRIGKAFK